MYLYVQVVEENYRQQRQVHTGPDQPLEFESDKIELDIPREGITLQEGWKITPLIAPVVRTKDCPTYTL